MKVLTAGLTNSTTVSYDKTKTTLVGAAYSKTINSQTVLGPPLTKAIDVQTDAGFAPIDCYLTANNRLFVLGALTSAGTTLALYNFTPATGAATYVGKILFTLPNTAATTHTLRMFKVDDTTPSSLKILVGTTGSVLINGGLMLVNAVNVTDFVPVGFPTIFQAITSSAKAVYMLQDPAGLGVSNNMTAVAGGAAPGTYSANSSINTKAYVHNGIAATHQYFIHDYSVAPTITSYACTSPTVAASPTFTMTAHPFAANDPVVITVNAPGGFTATTASAVQTVYFVRNPTANTFELSATTGGALINATTAVTPTLCRAFGQTTSTFTLKTGNLPALAGTLLLTDSEDYCMPAHSTNSGFECVSFGTTTNLYFGKLSELTSLTTTWPSLITSNVLGTGIDITTPTPTYLTYGFTTDNFIYVTNTSTFVVKQLVNNVIRFVFGGLSNQYIETLNPTTLPFALAAVVGITAKQGWLFAVGSTVGQRVILAINLRSDDYYQYSYVVSPVLFTNNALPRFLQTFEQLFDVTDSLNLYFRSAATSGDAVFSSATGGWTLVPNAKDLSSYSFQAYTQFKIGYQIATLLANTPAQVAELFAAVTPQSELSDNWVGSVDNTSPNGISPAYTAFRLQTAYATSVPTLYFRAYDDSGNLVVSANTSANPTSFSYSTNNGTSWNALGTIPNTPLTTEVRYAWASPPGVRVTCSIRES